MQPVVTIVAWFVCVFVGHEHDMSSTKTTDEGAV